MESAPPVPPAGSGRAEPAAPPRQRGSGGTPPQPPAVKRKLWPVLAVAVSVLSLLVAAASTLIAWRALDQAKDAKAIALRPAGDGQPVRSSSAPTVPATTAPAEPPAVDPTTGEANDDIPLNTAASYTVAYQGENLRVQVRCDNNTYVDLDKPEVGSDYQISDLAMEVNCGPSNVPTFSVTTPAASLPQGDLATLTAKDCVEAVRTGPLAEGATVPVKQGVVMCVLTSGPRAATQGISRKVVAIQVLGVVDEDATDTASVRVNAWNIPR